MSLCVQLRDQVWVEIREVEEGQGIEWAGEGEGRSRGDNASDDVHTQNVLRTFQDGSLRTVNSSA